MLGPVYIYWGRLSVLAGISLLDCVRVCAWFCSCCCCSCAVVDVVVAILCVFTTSFFPISQLPFIIIPENSFLVYGRMLTAFSTVFGVVRESTQIDGDHRVSTLLIRFIVWTRFFAGPLIFFWKWISKWKKNEDVEWIRCAAKRASNDFNFFLISNQLNVEF